MAKQTDARLDSNGQANPAPAAPTPAPAPPGKVLRSNVHGPQDPSKPSGDERRKAKIRK